MCSGKGAVRVMRLPVIGWSKLIERACSNVLASGLRTADVMAPGAARIGTSVMGESVVRELDKLAA